MGTKVPDGETVGQRHSATGKTQTAPTWIPAAKG